MSAVDRREQILHEATNLVSQRGFYGVTLRDIAQACELTEAGLLHYATSKDDLLIQVLERRDELDLINLAARLGISRAEIDRDPLPIGLREMCRALVLRNKDQPEIVRLYTVLQAEALDTDHPAHPFFTEREKWVLDLFRRAAVTENMSPPEVIALQILAAMDGLQLRWLQRVNQVDLVEQWDLMMEHILAQSSS